jgi:ABC-type transport system substrate-binding protein
MHFPVRYFRSLFVPVVTASLILAVSGQTIVPGKPRLGGTLRVKPFADVFTPNLDPAESTSSVVLNQLYDGLVRLDDDFNIIPSLAEYWVISDGGRKYTFYLRKGAKFHHGREVTAEDVKFSLERLVRMDTGTLYFQSFKGKVVGADEFAEGRVREVEGFKAVDRTTFEIDWKQPCFSGMFLLSMDLCKILPMDLVLSQGENFFMKPSGTGPFKFGEWLRSARFGIEGVRLERNGDYFGELPYLDAVEFNPFFSFERFRTDEIQVVPLQSEDLAAPPFQVLENDSLDLFYLGLSCDIPPFDRKDVRAAVALALDKDRIVKAAYAPESVPRAVDSFIPTDLPGFFPLDGRKPSDPDRAAGVLAEAGLGRGRKYPEILLRLPMPQKDVYMRIFRELRRQLEALGIRLDYEYVQSLRDPRPPSRPFLQLFEWVMDFPDAENVILPVFQSRAFLNKATMNYSDPLLDGLLTKAEIELDWELRTGIFRRIEALLDADVPAIPLYRLRFRMALQPYVRGAEAPPMGFRNLNVRDIWFER